MILLACYHIQLSFPLSAIQPSGSLALSWGSTLTSRWSCITIAKTTFCLGLIKIASDTFSSKVGEHAIDYANVAQKEKLSELQLRVRQLLDQVSSLLIVLDPPVILVFRWSRLPRSRTTRGDVYQLAPWVISSTIQNADIARRGSGRPVRAPTRGCCGGKSSKQRPTWLHCPLVMISLQMVTQPIQGSCTDWNSPCDGRLADQGLYNKYLSSTIPHALSVSAPKELLRG